MNVRFKKICQEFVKNILIQLKNIVYEILED